VKLAFDNRHILALVLTAEFTLHILYIDQAKQQILGHTNLLYSTVHKIKDFLFYPNSYDKFITCGIQNISVWVFKGGILSCHSLQLENPSDLVLLSDEDL